MELNGEDQQLARGASGFIIEHFNIEEQIGSVSNKFVFILKANRQLSL